MTFQNFPDLAAARGQAGISVFDDMHWRDRSAIASKPTVRAELLEQAAVAARLGSRFVSRVLRSAIRNLDRAPLTAASIDAWPGNPSTDALAMRLNAGLHAMARRGEMPMLEALYAGRPVDCDAAIANALATYDQQLVAWLAQTPQTNEVGRAAAILSALMVATESHRYPCELLELGSSAGLNLNLARYSYTLGGIACGDASSRVVIAPEWRGAPPPDVAVAVQCAAGVDLSPLDPADRAVRERLLAYVWADEPLRSQRLSAALDLARRYPPAVARDDALHWLTRKLDAEQAAATCRVVFHSMVLQYMAPEKRAALVARIRTAGAGASDRRPLAWIGFEWTEDRARVLLRLTTWPGGEPRDLAECHPYGKWVRWLD